MDVSIFVKAGIALVGIIILAITARNIHIKMGDKEFSFQSREKIRQEVTTQSVKVVTEYADFKYALKEDRDRAIKDLHTKAKWNVSVELESYYQTVIEKVAITNAFMGKIISIMTEAIKPKQQEFLMSIYEINHLKSKTDDELTALVEERYPILANIFRQYAQIHWDSKYGSLQDLFDVFEDLRETAKNTMIKLLQTYRFLSKEKDKIYLSVEMLDGEVRLFVIDHGHLPSDAMQRAQDIHHGGISH